MELSATQHYIDNKGLDDKLKKFGTHSKYKFIDLKTKGLREDMAENLIEVKLISRDIMLADALTKAASKESITLLKDAVLNQ